MPSAKQTARISSGEIIGRLPMRLAAVAPITGVKRKSQPEILPEPLSVTDQALSRSARAVARNQGRAEQEPVIKAEIKAEIKVEID
jgi:hypothetical protein